MDHPDRSDTVTGLPSPLVPSRRALLLASLGLVLCGGAPRAQEARYLRIATGSAAGTYFPVGETMARLLSHPPGLPACDVGAPCGVPGLVATAETSQGSVDNVQAVASRAVETALAQADVVALAHAGKLFPDRPPLDNLRVIANLYRESMHLVARRDAGIATVKDLAGKRVSLDRAGSGTRGDALMILKAHGVSPKKLTEVELGPSQAADALVSGEIDAFFFLGGVPAAGIADIAPERRIVLIPINGPARDRLLAEGRFFMAGFIPSGAYPTVMATETVDVGAQWICAAEAAEPLIYDITRTLFAPENAASLAAGHPRAAAISLAGATAGIAVPLHPGAARFYQEKGIELPVTGPI
ncbi:TAXI family TRAP transporter solute-binding subunit [Zavarzinia aquatilis]|uniref:Immunogenic protein n=1 Tax=Zavarzinia aquatilis TaxID=2211142 RepID=A0A317EGM5_9PROT|nr:TAXI family TRAP transporter solute-binding subunit [Zavarzinia aquatilis]PWR24365.1 immunogenic protein [Zavarzinia aquatilis]